jgi:hypothetical protein
MLGNDSWYFVTPDGALYRNTGSTNLASNVKITQLDATYYANPALIYEAAASNVMLSQQALTQVAHLGLHFHVSYFENWGGLGEKWIYSSTNQAYFITSNGNLYQWSGSSNLGLSPFVANIGSKFHADPTLFNDIHAFGAWGVQEAGKLKQDLGLRHPGSYSINWGGWGEKWIKGTAGSWYFITPSGGLYAWQGGGPASLRNSPLIATLDPSYHTFPGRLHDAVAPSSMSVGVGLEAVNGIDNGLTSELVDNPTNYQAESQNVDASRVIASNQALSSNVSKAAIVSNFRKTSRVAAASPLAEPARSKAFDELASSSTFDELDALLNALQTDDVTPLQAVFSDLGSSRR